MSRKLDFGLLKKAKAVVGTLWGVSPEIYHDLCSSTWLFASFLKTHSCSFLSAFLYCYDHHSMSITILTNKTLRDSVLFIDLVSSILLYCFWSINYCVLHGSAVSYDLCSLSPIAPIWFPLGFAIATHWNWFPCDTSPRAWTRRLVSL